MSKVSVSANIIAKSHPGMTVERAIEAAEADLLQLRQWLTYDPATPYTCEVGARLVSVGQYLMTLGPKT